MKNKKGQENPMMILFGVIILVLVALALITSVANTKSTQTDLSTVSNEQSNLMTLGCYEAGQVNESNSACNITVTNWYDSDDWRASNAQCYLTSVSVTNDTATALTLDTDYHLFSDTGIIQLLNTTDTSNASATLLNNIVEIDYSYCESGYLTNSGDRGLANLWVTMMVLVLLGSVAAVAMKLMKS